MNRLLLGAALAATSCAPRLDPGPIPANEAQRPVTIVSLPDDASPNIYLQAIVAAGSSWDAPGQEGLAQLTARTMVDGGAGDRDGDALRDALYPTGNSLQLVVDREWVSVRLRCHRDHASLCIDLFADVLTAPRFADGDVLRLRDDALFDVTDGILGDEEALGENVFHGVLYEGHPYGHPVNGRAGALPTLDAADLRDFHSRHYVRQAMRVGVAGAVSDTQREQLVARLEAVPGRPAPDGARMAPPAKEGRSLTIVATSTPVTGFHIGHLLPTDRNHPDWPALHVAMTAFGAHRQSFGRLFRTIRAARGLNYGDYAYVEPYVQQGWSPPPENGVLRRTNHFSMWLRPTSVENGPFALKLALYELDALLAEGLTEEEFARTVSSLQGSVPLLATDPGRRLAYALDAEITGTPNLLERLPEALETLTREEVHEALKRHLDPSMLAIVAVSGDPDGLRAALVGDAPTPVTYADATPDEAQAARDTDVAAMVLGLTESDTVTVDAQGVFQ